VQNWGIKMTDRPNRLQDHDDLEAFFGAARRVAPVPSDALMGRVLNDALAAQDAQSAPIFAPEQILQSLPQQRSARPGLWAQLREALGGWPAFGGLAMAGATGLAIGIAAPGGVMDLTSAVLAGGGANDSYLVDLMPELEFDIAMDLNEG
jgi:hypothetical protein